ncbi:MAG TPA: hypothetical protein VGI28_11805 [Stellaceae bacterium]
MRRSKLVGIVVCCAAWVGASNVLQSAVSRASVIPDLAELTAGSDTGLPDRVAVGGSFIAQVSAVAKPCSDADEFGRPTASCQKKAEPAGPASLPSPDLPFGPAADTLVAPSEISAAASDFDFTATRSFDGLQTPPSSITPELLDELIARPDEADDAGPFWSGNGDILLHYMVPALAILALSIAGLLLREVVRRRRRATLARHIKRSFGRSARRRLGASPRPSD